MFKARVITEGEEQLFEGVINQAVLPTPEEEISILAFHHPIICRLCSGNISLDKQSIPIKQGLAKFEANELTVIVEPQQQ